MSIRASATLRPASVREVPHRSPAGLDAHLLLGLILIACLCASAALAPLIAPFNPLKQDYRHMLVSPAWPHLLGTDEFGRDILSRLLWGGRISLTVAGGALLVAAGIGVPTGVTAAYFGRLADTVLMRFTDLMIVFPPILLAIAIVSFLGASLVHLAVIIGLTNFPRFSRLAYVVTLQARTNLFVEASRAMGAGDTRILIRDILPTIFPTLLVEAALTLGFAILIESGLSFLGLGIQPPTPSWGLMIADARMVMAQSPLYILWPSLTITTTVLAFQITADGLRDALDPKSQHQYAF
jgi:peptide/nickel transport system permease protein